MVERISRNDRAGFALVEILIAILILGTSLVTILSLQSSAVKRALRDRTQQNAMLVARSIMSAVEIDPEQLEPQDTTMPVKEMLAELLPERSNKTDEEIDQFFGTFEANLRVEEAIIPVPGQDPILMKKVYLLVFWGPGPTEQLETIFFVRQDSPI